MGGLGSTRWGWHKRAITVEECRSLDCTDFRRKGFLGSGILQFGNVSWFDNFDRMVANLGFTIATKDMSGFMELNYILNSMNGGADESFRYRIGLQTTRPNFGGLRWWFTCPSCNRRVRKIYRPPMADRYLCRDCHQLSYKSSQESDQRVSDMRRLGTSGILERLNSGNVNDLIFGLRALPDWIWR